MVPDMYNVESTCTAWLYGPTAGAALDVDMMVLVMVSEHISSCFSKQYLYFQ